MHWEYIQEVLKSAWFNSTVTKNVAELIIGILVIFALPRVVTKKFISNLARGRTWPKRTLYKFLTNSIWRSTIVLTCAFICHVLVISPYYVYKNLKSQIVKQTPILRGFIDQCIAGVQAGTNTLLFLEVEVGNAGSSPSIAQDYVLSIILTNRQVKVDPIDFQGSFQADTYFSGKPYSIDLRREDLISEKTSRAIGPGENPRGWIAFRIPDILHDFTNAGAFVLSFMDINGKRSFTTNGYYGDKPSGFTVAQSVKTQPGSRSIMVPKEISIATNTFVWMPPELPPQCSNVTIFFGAQGFTYPRLLAEVGSNGKQFAIADLPENISQDLEKTPDYSPRNRFIWLKRASVLCQIGEKAVQYPVQPYVVSNRLCVEALIPFSNEKRNVAMSDNFDDALHIPRLWDRNYSTNYDATGGVFVYEVVNELTNPVMQVAYAAPNEIHINGIFLVDSNSILASFGQEPRLYTFGYKSISATNTGQRITTISLESDTFSEIIQIRTNDSIEFISQILTNEFYRPIFPGQKAIFKYPSNRNLGVFSN